MNLEPVSIKDSLRLFDGPIIVELLQRPPSLSVFWWKKPLLSIADRIVHIIICECISYWGTTLFPKITYWIWHIRA